MAAMTVAWNRVTERFRYLERYEDLRPTVAAMLRLVAALRDEPRLVDVEPSVSLASLNLRPGDLKRYVVVSRVENGPHAFKVSFVDPPLEFRETQQVGETEVVATIVEYLDRLRREG